MFDIQHLNFLLILVIKKYMKKLVLIFVKNPIVGRVKTRLANTIGNEKALAVYQCLLKFTQKIIADLNNVDKQVWYADFINPNDLWNDYSKKLQVQDSSLGKRMQNAFAENFSTYQAIGIIGSDCLELSTEILQQAFEKLKQYDVVIGPAKDGGYYFLGMKHYYHFLFENKKWSTDSVFLDTIEDLKTHQLSYFLLETLSDIDTENDLKNIEWVSIC